MQRHQAASLLQRIEGRRVLVVGDLLLDSFVYGEARRVSREAPVPILSEMRRAVMLGGAGNLARNIDSLGGAATVVGVVGDDADGESVQRLAAECSPGAALIAEPGRPTSTKIRYVSNNQQMFCVDRDPETAISGATAQALIAAVQGKLADCDVVALSDYGRGALIPDVCRAVIDAARQAGKPVCVDPRGLDFTRYDGATVIKPNAQELAAEAGLPVASDEDAESALAALMARMDRTEALLVTRGAQGMSLLRGGDPVVHRKGRARQVFDVSGAGDTALAALCLGVAAGVDLRDAMALADLAAGTAVGKLGTATVTPDEVLEDAFAGARMPDWRVIDRDEAAELAENWRAEGLKVGFTNGCFDILHPGHLSVLRHARAACDRLVVGLNDDASVARLKGRERPINPAGHRALMLASLESVDRVVLFAEDTPQALIEAVRPDVLVKGADYAADDLPGAAFIKSYGGEIVLAPLEPGLSTTRLVERLQNRS